VTHDDRTRPTGAARSTPVEGPFGQPIRRKEDQRLAAGDGRYLDDLGHHALAAAFLRSPHAHARIVDIDISDALTVDGLVAVYTYEDLDGRVAEPLPLLIPHPSLRAPRTNYALANGVVNHVGEAVVMVVATDRYVAEDAVERIRVEWEVLPPVVGPGRRVRRRARGPRRRARQRRRPHGAGGGRRGGRDRGGARAS
jgi:CO/xanthine dehydrogenase Mo-binding subunit